MSQQSAASGNSSQKVITAIVVLFVIALLVFGIDATKKQPIAQTAAPASTTPSNVTSTGTYKDGTYMAVGKYNSPGGTQMLNVSLTLAGNIISDTTAKGSATSGVATIYQSDFVNSYKSMVVGKKLDLH
jgi:hypothetical protein